MVCHLQSQAVVATIGCCHVHRYDANCAVPLRNSPGDEEWALGPQQLRMPPWVAAWWAASTQAAGQHSGAAAATTTQPASRHVAAEASTAAAHGEGSLHSEVSSSSSAGSTQGFNLPFSKDSFVSFSMGFCSWINQLCPTEHERGDMHATVKGVTLAAAAACKGQAMVCGQRAASRELQEEHIPAQRVSACSQCVTLATAVHATWPTCHVTWPTCGGSASGFTHTWPHATAATAAAHVLRSSTYIHSVTLAVLLGLACCLLHAAAAAGMTWT